MNTFFEPKIALVQPAEVSNPESVLRSPAKTVLRCRRYVTLDWQGVKVGVMGLAEEDWLSTLPLIDLEDLIYLDYVEEARRICRVLREEEQVDLVVALTHMRVPNDMHLAAEVPGIDLVLGGHDHHYEVMTSEPNGTLVVKSGTDFREMTLLKVMLGESRPKVRCSSLLAPVSCCKMVVFVCVMVSKLADERCLQASQLGRMMLCDAERRLSAY